MAIISVLNTILQADTSGFDSGLKKAGKSVDTLRAGVQDNSQRVTEALKGVGQISGLDGILGQTFSRVRQTLGAIGQVIQAFRPRVPEVAIGAGPNIAASENAKAVSATAAAGRIAAAGNIASQATTSTAGKIAGANASIGTSEMTKAATTIAAGAKAAGAHVASSTAATAASGKIIASNMAIMASESALAASVSATAAIFIAAKNRMADAAIAASGRIVGANMTIIGSETTLGAAAGGRFIASEFDRAAAANVASTRIEAAFERPIVPMARLAGEARTLSAATNQAMSGIASTAATVGGRVAGSAGQMAAAVSVAGSRVAASTNIAAASIRGGAAAAGLMASGLGLLAAAAAVVTGGVIALGVSITYMASRGAADLKHLHDVAKDLDISPEALTSFSLDPGLNGIDGVASSIFRLQSSLGNMSAEGRAALNAMQVDLDALNAASAEQQIRMLADGYMRLSSQGERAGAIRAIFGRGGVDMIGLLENGSAGLDELTAQASRFGLMVSASQTEALERATVQWRGLGLAIQGISRQAAVMFTPLWESVGKVGSAIGERLVGMFRAAQPHIEQVGNTFARIFRPVWDRITMIGGHLADMFVTAMPIAGQFGKLAVEAVSTLFEILGGGGIVFKNWESLGPMLVSTFKQAAPWVKIVLETVTSYIGAIGETAKMMWSVVFAPFEAFGRLLLTSASESDRWVAQQNGGWNSIGENALRVLATITVVMRNMRMVGGMMIDELKVQIMELRRSLGEGGLDADIARIRAGIARGAGNIRGQIAEQVARWRAELAGAAGVAADAQQERRDEAAQRATARERAIAGSDVAERGSLRAFQLLNATRGEQDFQRQQAAAAAQQRAQLLAVQQAQLAEIRRAPGIRRARL